MTGGLLSVSLLMSLGTRTKSSSGLEHGVSVVSGSDLLTIGVPSSIGIAIVPGDDGNSIGTGLGLGLSRVPVRNAWPKNWSKSMRSVASRLNRPIKRLVNSSDVPGGILKKKVKTWDFRSLQDIFYYNLKKRWSKRTKNSLHMSLNSVLLVCVPGYKINGIFVNRLERVWIARGMWGLPGETLIQYSSYGPQIRLSVVLERHNDFRRHVHGRSAQSRGHHAFLQEPSETEIR